MSDYLTSDTNTLVWFCFTVYVVTAVFLLPNSINLKFDNADVSYQKAVQFASRFVLRITLIFPMVFLLKNNF
ncbi:MAG: hypothetical protein Tsb0014_37100 [Pleurocapsa sp.]